MPGQDWCTKTLSMEGSLSFFFFYYSFGEVPKKCSLFFLLTTSLSSNLNDISRLVKTKQNYQMPKKKILNMPLLQNQFANLLKSL